MDPFGNPHGTWPRGMHPVNGTNPNSSKPVGNITTNPNAAPAQQQQQGQRPPRQPPHNQPILQVCAEVKPRLTKEQHDILERHFQQQPKPSTTVKKGFAQALGVPLDKINNWFQNRRAKVKQDLKKQYNALQLLQGHPSLQGSLQSQPRPPFLPVSQPLPSSNPADFPNSNTVLPSTEYPVQTSAPDSRNVPIPAFPMSRQTDFNPMVPTILETTHPGSSENIVQSLQNAGYAVQEPQMVQTGLSSEDPMGFQPPFSQEFVNVTTYPLAPGLNGFPGQFGEIPTGMPQSFAFQPDLPAADPSMIPMEQGLPGMPASQPLTSIPSSASISSMQSLTAPFTNPNWSEDSNSAITVPTGSPTSELDGSSSDATNQHNEMWQSTQSLDPLMPQKQIYQQPNPSAPMLTTPQDESSNQLGPPELPSDAFIRRNSSTSALAESLDSVGINASSDSESTFKQPGEPSSIAARRQRPRPANLGPASLRSASYSAGMPVSPGANNLAAPDQQLRRIRSGGMSNGRIQKPGTVSGQRSPLNFTFAEAAASPKFARHASMQSNVSSPTVSITTSSLAPPTPNTPNDFTHWPPWQAPGIPKSYSNTGSATTNGVAVCWPNDGMGLMVNVSSPPDTPLDAEQAAQFQAYMQHQQMVFRDTPPQSAPATQQSFSQTSMMPSSLAMSSSMSNSLPVADDKIAHLRRPSLPDGTHAVHSSTLNSMQQCSVPMFNSAGDLQMSQPVPYGMPNGMQQASMAQMPQAMASFTNPFTSSSSQSGVVKPDFSVHEYSPPQMNGTLAFPPRADSAQPVKTYHFANAGPSDFAIKQEPPVQSR